MAPKSKWTLESYAFGDIEVTLPAPGVAIIAYTVAQTITMHGKSQDLGAANSSTWIKGTDGWECHAYSEAILKDKNGSN